MDIEFTKEGLEAARTASTQHIEGRGNEYVAAWSPLDGPGTRTYDAVYRSNQPNRRTLGGNRRSGIYLILDRDANSAYVGLTNNFSDRFFNGNPRHPRGCRQGCRCHGHITITLETCTSHNIINTDSDSGYSVHILDEIPYSGDRISQAEIEWYYILDEHGFEMVNAVHMLGKKGYIGRPIISLDIKQQIYHFFPTISESSISCYGELYSGNPGAISTVLGPQNNQASGFTHRYATLDEVRKFTEGIDVDNLINNLDRTIVWRRVRNGPIVDIADSCPGCIDPKKKHGRLFHMTWDGGPLNEVDINHLRGTMKGPKGKTRKSKFRGVTWKKSAKPQGWQIKATKPTYPRFQTGPLKSWKVPSILFKHDLNPAIVREEKILENKWMGFNKGKRMGSNAKRINFFQPWRFISGNYFTDWEDGETGLLRVLIFYVSILSLLTAAVLQLFG